ncbi:GMC oxidoreductase [Salinarimonas sp. NSM]|uniref:GMC oxidoreductase n=1 Tax=Salinarimonas sp. NSM TaxID=3458003 RepID=UPI004035B821
MDDLVIIVGSGPAGVSAAHALLESGVRVLVIDNGTGPRAHVESEAPETIWDVRARDRGQAATLLGLSPSEEGGASTPKMRIPAFRHVQEGFGADLGLDADGVMPTGARATGGLSRMWGAGVPPYRAADMAGWPIDAPALAASFARVARRIGVAGDEDAAFYGSAPAAAQLTPPLVPPDPLARALERSRAGGAALRAQGFALSLARNAVATRDLGRRRACSACGRCLYGCPTGTIYDAGEEVHGLVGHPRFTIRHGIVVTRVARGDGGFVVHGRGRDEPPGTEREIAAAARVVLAAGTIATTTLVARHLGRLDDALPLQAHPAFALAFIAPGRVGGSMPERFFALSSLSFGVADEAAGAYEGPHTPEIGFGSVFPAASVPASELVLRAPFSRPASAALVRLLQPAMALANCYLPGRYADVALTVGAQGVRLRGRHAAEFEPAYRRVRARVTRAFRTIGLHAVPTSATIAHLGSDGHYVGGVPMSAPGASWGCDRDGEVIGAPGLHVVDGAALPALAARHPTFTIMANADRIGRRLGERIARGEAVADPGRATTQGAPA